MKAKLFIGALAGVFAVTFSHACSQSLRPQLQAVGAAARKKDWDKSVTKQLYKQYAWLHDWKWAKEPWTGNDRVYQVLRSGLNKQLASANDKHSLLTKYKVAAEHTPADPKALFRWGYTAYHLATQTGIPDQQGVVQLAKVEQAFPFARFPQTYEYARLRFLVQSYSFGAPNLAPVGERLLKLHPSDTDVKYNYVRCLTNNPNPSVQLRALASAQELVQQNPSVPGMEALLASIYYTLWYTGGDHKLYAAKAVASYQKYLQLAPASYAFRKTAEDNIAWIQEKEAGQSQP